MILRARSEIIPVSHLGIQKLGRGTILGWVQDDNEIRGNLSDS